MTQTFTYVAAAAISVTAGLVSWIVVTRRLRIALSMEWGLAVVALGLWAGAAGVIGGDWGADGLVSALMLVCVGLCVIIGSVFLRRAAPGPDRRSPVALRRNTDFGVLLEEAEYRRVAGAGPHD